MEYPKHDNARVRKFKKEEFERHKVESEKITGQAIQDVSKLIIVSVLAILLVIIILNKSQPEKYTVTKKENVVVTKIVFPIGKNSKVLVNYKMLDGTKGEFQTREIWFSVRDTILINVRTEVLVKNNQ